MDVSRPRVICCARARAWGALAAAWRSSALCRGLTAFFDDILLRWASGSVICRWFSKDGWMGPAWRTSLFGRLVTWVANLIPSILHWIYRRAKGLFDGSLFCRLTYAIGDQTAVLTSWVAASMIWKSMLSPEYGAVNNILAVFGIQGPGWLLDEAWAMPAIVLVSVWKDMGFFGLILLSGMVGINKSYYEAASLDGAGSWQKFWKITLPLITPPIYNVLIVSLINAFQLVPQIMIMTAGGSNGATQVMVERIYKYGFRYYRMGYAAAFSWILFAIIMVCTAIQMKGQERWVNYDS